VGAIRKLQSVVESGASRFLFRDGILLIPLAALLASTPRIARGVSCGHDFEFHLVSWLETQRSWSQGVPYPHWAQTPNWGAGEARFVFYPPLTWMLGALLGYLIPWVWIPAALTFLCLAAVGISTRALAQRFLPEPNATLAGVIATTTPYALFTAYERTAFSELAAAFWIPLLLLCAWRQCEFIPPQVSQIHRSLDGSATPLAIILAATWLTNAPAGVMASYLLAFAALAAALIQREWWPILRAAVAVVIALGLAAFYLVPAALEQHWIAIQQAVDVGMRVSDSWLFTRHSSPDLQLHDQVLHVASNIVVLTSVLALAALIVCLVRRKLSSPGRRFWLPLALLIPILFLLQLPISAPVWNLLPRLQFLQFPWRWLMVLGAPFAIFVAAATPLRSRRSRAWSACVWIAILLILTGSATRIFFQICDEEDQVDNQVAVFHAGTGVEGTDEYAAAGSDNSLIASGLPDGCLVSDPTQQLGESDAGAAPVWYSEQGSCDDTYTAQVWQNEHKILQIDSDHDGFVVLRLSRNPAWYITVNGKPVTTLTDREDGLIALPVSAGPSNIEIRWNTTPDVLHGRSISLASLVLLAGLWMAERRFKAIRLSSRECT
jgi:6-pyruvoyl-tetrahydropterin synthase-like protein